MIGKGVFGSVVKCTNTETENEVAVKVIRSKEVYRLSGEKELRVLRELNEGDPYGNTINLRD